MKHVDKTNQGNRNKLR
jgi:hypothetical protein